MGLELAPLPAQPAAVEAEAMAWRQQVGSVDASGQATRNAFSTVVASWFGSLYDLVSAAPEPIVTEAERVRGDTLYNAGVLDLWANALRVLETKRNALITQFDNAGPTYGAEQVDLDEVEPDNVSQAKENNATAVQTAKSELRTKLTNEYSLAVGELDETAQQVATLMEQGATPENLRMLFELGVIPRGDVPFFPGWMNIFDLSQGLPPELEGMTADEMAAAMMNDPALAAWAMSNRPGTNSADPSERALALAMATPGSPQDKMDAVRAAFDAMSPEDRNRMAVLFPGIVGNLNGVPFDQRAKANQISIADARFKEQANLADLQEQLDNMPFEETRVTVPDGEFSVNNSEERAALQAKIDASKQLLDRYDEFLGIADDGLVPNYGADPGAPGRIPPKIIYFQPGLDGGVVALTGSIDGDTRHVGVLVPGTGTSLGSSDAPIRTSGSFVEENGGGDLAMITWVGGKFPSGLTDAISSDYANDNGQPLADFSYALDQEINANAESVSGQDVDVTTIGHSYGGAVVGAAQTHGLYTDNVIHVESAGMGPDVYSSSDYNPPGGKPPTTYSMTAPGDPIAWVQGSELGQGAAPWGGDIIELETGYYPAVLPEHPELAGQLVEGSAAHGDVIDTPGTGAWWNIYGVMTDGPLSVVEPPPPGPPVAEPPPSDQPDPPPTSTEAPPPAPAPTPPPAPPVPVPGPPG